MEKEIQRLKDLLPTLNPISSDYTTAVNNLRTLCLTADLLGWKEDVDQAAETVAEPTPMAEPVQATVVAEQEPVVTAKVEVKDSYTKAEVRAMLSEASKSGIQIQPIIAKFIPEGKSIKFSEVPETSYVSLVKELNDAR